jgi:hypothetical protein
MLITTFSKGIVWLNYEVNKDFISKNLCINRSKPVLHCKGKCQLMKKLAEDDKDNSTPAPKLKTGLDETAMLIATDHGSFEVKSLTEFNFFVKTSAYNTPVYFIFHPPA